MSELSRLKQRLDELAKQSRTQAGHLDSFKSQLTRVANDVAHVAGGSARGQDKAVIAAITDAQKKLDAAVHGLQDAARQASSFSASL